MTTRFAVGVAVFMGLAAAGAALLRAVGPEGTPSLDAVEVTLHAALLLALFRASPRLWRTVAALPRVHTVPLATMFLLMYTAQLLGQARVTFPFANWALYGLEDRLQVVQYYRLVARSGDGTAVAVGGNELFPVANWLLISRLDELAETGDAGPLNELAAAYLDRFNERHPTETISSLAIVRCLEPIFPRVAAQCVELTAVTGVRP